MPELPPPPSVADTPAEPLLPEGEIEMTPPPLDPGSTSPLDHCANLRMPTFEEGTSANQRVAVMEEYLYRTAVIEGEVHELRLGAQRSVEADERVWDLMRGWEANLRHPSKSPTVADVNAAKTAMDPTLGLRLRQGRWTISRCNEALERLERETNRISRVYRFITGQ